MLVVANELYMAVSVCKCSAVAIRVSGVLSVFVFFQAEDGIRDLVRSRGLGDVYKRQARRASRTNLTTVAACAAASASACRPTAPVAPEPLSLIHI